MDRSAKAKKGGLSPPTAVKSLVTIWNKDRVKEKGIRPSTTSASLSPSDTSFIQATTVIPDPKSTESSRIDHPSSYSVDTNEDEYPQDDCIIQSSVRTAVEGFYLKYNPEKIDTIETILQHYVGFELELVLHLIEKYEAIDESDLQIFAGYVSDQELLDIASHQIKVKKQALLARNEGTIASSSSVDNANETLSNHSSNTNSRSRNGSTASKLNGNQSIDSTDQPTSQSSVDVGIQDRNRRHHGGNNSNNGSITNSPTSPNMTKTMPSSSSGSTNKTDEMLLMKKIHNLESQITLFESENLRMQTLVVSLESEKESLNENLHTLTAQMKHIQAENISLTNNAKNGSTNAIPNNSRSDGLQANSSLSTERETAMKKENMILHEQYKFAESNRQEMQSRLLEEIGMKENKQRQLMETIKLTQRLEAQVRYLAANAFESLKFETVIQVPMTSSSNSSHSASSTGSDIDQETIGEDKTKEELLQELSLLKHHVRYSTSSPLLLLLLQHIITFLNQTLTFHHNPHLHCNYFEYSSFSNLGTSIGNFIQSKSNRTVYCCTTRCSSGSTHHRTTIHHSYIIHTTAWNKNRIKNRIAIYIRINGHVAKANQRYYDRIKSS